MARKREIHIVLQTDSLSLPRRWNIHEPDAHRDKHFVFERTYPALLSSLLSRRFASANCRITNLGAHSATMTQAAAAAPATLELYRPDALVVQHGVVDCWIRAEDAGMVRTPLETFRQAAARIVAHRDALAPDCVLIFVAVLPLDAAGAAKYPEQNAMIEAYNAALLGVCVEGKATYLDLNRRKAEGSGGLHHLDAMHLSVAGHAAMAQGLASVLAVHLKLASK